MANIGPTTAFYKVETSLTRANNDANISRERIASGKQIAYAGDRVSNLAMIDAFRLDHVSTKAGIKGASVVMGYLETGMKVIGNASNLLTRLQELAVLGANGTNTFEEYEMINAEAEAIAQEFNRLMQGANYKGKDIFVETAGSEYLSMGARNAELTFGLGKIEYSELFDALRQVQEGLPNAGQLVNLVKLPSDSVIGNSINFQTVVGADSLEIEVSSNLARADLLTLEDTGNITIDENGIVYSTFEYLSQGEITLAIGEIDATKNGSAGILKINFYEDATIPDSGNLINGDFEAGTQTQFGVPTEVYSSAGFEHRAGMVNTFSVQNSGNGYVEFSDTLSTALARGSNTYSISFDSNGAGTGFRANVIVADDGSLSIGEVLDKGQGYSVGEILTITQDARGTALAGSDFSINVTSTLDSNDNDPGRNSDNIQEVTQANFQSVNYTVENGPDGRYAWGESFTEGTAERIATNDGSGSITNYIHAVGGNYAEDGITIDGIAQPLFTDVYENDDVSAGVLIVENFNPIFAQDDAILEQVSVADYMSNAGGNNNGTETIHYAINPADGQRVTTTWTYDEYTTGVANGSITPTGATVTQNISGVTNILVGDYDGGGPQYIDTPNYGVAVIAVGDQLPTDTVVYNRESSSGTYAWGGGSYTNGSIVKDPTGSDITANIRHAADGAYTFDISGTDFNPADLNYSAGEEVLEFVTWADQFDPDNPPAGTTVYRTDVTHAADGAYTFDITGTDFDPADLNYSAGDVRLEFTAWADQFDPDNPPAGSTVYRTDITHDADGAYTFDVTGTDFDPVDLNYSAGDDPLEFIAWADQFDPDNPPAGSTVYRTDILHDADGTYTFNVAETNFNPANLNYSAGDVRLEFIAWADQFDPDNPPAGSTVYRTDDELASPAFFTRLEVASPEFFTRTQVAPPEFFTSNEVASPEFFTSTEVGSPAFFTRIDDSLASPEFFTRSAGTVSYSNSISHYERSVITDYDRREITGYSREEVAFYTRNKQLRTAVNISGQVEKYLGETRVTNNPDGSLIRAHIGWERDDNQVYINNWKTFDGRVEFGSTFQVFDTDGTYAWGGDGTGFNPADIPSITVPTPTIEEMAKPDYGSFTRLNGSPGNPAIKNKDDAATVPVEQSNGEDIRDYADTFSLDTPDVPVGLVSDASLEPPFSGAAMELFTGKLKFEDSAAFGIYHGPAVVSEQFSAEEGQFLKLNYSAAGDVDDYHVAGYIYEVDAATGNPVLDENGDPKIFMALNETGTVELNGNASVEIEASGEYRFVFVVGTFDRTGGLAAGASMKIDNIVAEFPFERDEEFIADLLKTVNYSNADTIADDSNTFSSTIRNNGSSLATDEVIELLEGFNADQMLPTLNLTNTETTEVTPYEAINISVLTSKIEAVQQDLNNARVRAGSQYMALESALISATDLTAQYQMGYDIVHDLDFSNETAELTRKQILQQAANALLAQANNGQHGLLKMLTR